jgi:catechol 2,3-dioxygenase-like lactoylglutathione lyase family enzyme
MTTATRVRHVGLAVKSIDETLRFYRDTLGVPVVADETRDGVRSVTLPVGLSAVLLTETGEDRGIDHLAFDSPEPGVPRAGLALAATEHFGLSIRLFPQITPPPGPAGHVECIDHVVIGSGDSATVAAHFRDALGIPIKRTMSRPGTQSHLEFAKLFDVVLEFGGPPAPRPGPIEAKFWGLVFTVDDIDAVVADCRAAGYETTDPRPAVQPGAKISAVKHGTGGVPFALIQYNALPIPE